MSRIALVCAVGSVLVSCIAPPGQHGGRTAATHHRNMVVCPPEAGEHAAAAGAATHSGAAPLPAKDVGLPSAVGITLSAPEPGAVIRNRLEKIPISGLVNVQGAGPPRFDVMIVLDVSGSTAYPSGTDLDRDGKIGKYRTSWVAGLGAERNTDSGDSILSAEVLAVHSLADRLKSEHVRLGVVSFSGSLDRTTGRGRSPDQEDAHLWQPLTRDFSCIRKAVDALQRRGPSGGTNMAAGLMLAVRELTGLESARSDPHPDAMKIIFLLTDGKPSLPFGLASREDAEDVEAVIDAAWLARRKGVTIHAFLLGEAAIQDPIAVSETVRVTRGRLTAARPAGDIIFLLPGVSFANIKELIVVNITLNEMAASDEILLSPDGSFHGFVPARPGRNHVRLSALTADGRKGRIDFEVTYDYLNAPDPELEAELERIRTEAREARR